METKEFLIKTLDVIFEEMKDKNAGLIGGEPQKSNYSGYYTKYMNMYTPQNKQSDK